MATPLTQQDLSRALVRELPGACAVAFGGTVSAIDAPGTTGEGWTVAVPFGGAATGRFVIWTDALSAAACATRARPADEAPSDAAITEALAALAAQLASAVELTPEAAGLLAGAPRARRTGAPEAGDVVTVAFGDGATATFRVAAELAPAEAPSPAPLHDSRLEAVLEVDLPLVVRFGRAVMPLRDVADLGPGAVVDMGRAPDEPVELLVGERLVARGEVVIVAGNYGVRITEIAGGRRPADLEGRG